MNSNEPRDASGDPQVERVNTSVSEGDWAYPLGFFGARRPGAAVYLRDPLAWKLLEFFETKGLARIKEEDRQERWYDDWISFQAQNGIYAELLSPAEYSSRGGGFDLLRYVRFLEVFAFCSPAHGYSLQVTFLGLFSILMGANEALKREAVAALEAGKLLAFGVSERAHGSDLLASEFTVADVDGELLANGAKYYIGNADHASIISVLARRIDTAGRAGGRLARAPFILIAIRPQQSDGFRSLGKIRTLGVRAANVGSFEVKDHRLPESDVISDGRGAWDAVFGAVTLGKFFLGFGSIGMCEHALEEARAHLRTRVLYGKPAIDMPHIRAAMCQAYVRLTAMKLYAYRTLDYVHTATARDRRYLLYCAVQKAKVSTEGVRVMGLLSECVGARGFESDTYFEMALRDVPLIPGLEGSMHINLALAAQFIPRYFDRYDATLTAPPSLAAGEAASRENAYLTEAHAGGLHAIAFRPFLEAYRPLAAIGNAATFARQAAAFRHVSKGDNLQGGDRSDSRMTMLLGQCVATIAYGQMIAEGAGHLKMSKSFISALFALLIEDLAQWGLQLASSAGLDEAGRRFAWKMVKAPQRVAAEWDAVGQNL